MKAATKSRPCTLCEFVSDETQKADGYRVCPEHQCEYLLLRQMIDDANRRRAARV